MPVPLLALLPIITALAPIAAKAIGSALGGGEGKRVAAAIEPAVTDAAVRVFGTAEPEEIIREGRRDPSRGVEFAKEMATIAAQAQAVAAQMEIERLKLDVANVQGAREHQQKLIASGSWSGYASTIISIVILVGFFGTLTMLVWRPFSIDAGQREVLQIMLGALTLGFGAVINYWLGSSHGSKAKDEALADQARTAVEAMRDRPAPVAPVMVAPAPILAPAPSSEPQGQPQAAIPTESRFTSLIGDLLRDEGGYVNDDDDPGGCTNMGITLSTLRGWRAANDGSVPTCEDVRALTESEARQIYFSKYWNALRCDSLPPGLDYMVFDFGVNAGVSRAAKTLQTCLQKRDASLAADGVIGPLTLGVVAKVPPKALIDEFHAARMAFYRSLPHWPKYGKGWTARAERVLAAATAAASR